MACDFHCHLTLFGESEWENYINETTGKSTIPRISCATERDDWESNLKRSHEAGCIPAFGIHPWNVDHAKDLDLLFLKKFLEENPSSPIGEIGLDKTRDKLQKQLHFFEQQLLLAGELNRPVVIHMVKSQQELIQALKKNAAFHSSGYENPFPVMGIHSFIGSPQQVEQLLPFRTYFSYSMQSLRSKKTVQSLQTIPLEKLLVETDGPEQKKSDTQSSLLNPSEVVAAIAREKQMDIETLADAIQKNFQRFIRNQD